MVSPTLSHTRFTEPTLVDGSGEELVQPMQESLKPMTENEIARVVVDHSIQIHRALGPGLFESVYQRVLAYELRKAGLRVESEVPVPLEWDGQVLDETFRADLIVEGKVLLELKSLEGLGPVHKKQVLTYLKLLDLKLGLLLNFGAGLMKDGTHRIANGLEEGA